MPKMKTRKSVAKRYSVTANGKVKYKKQNMRHILSKKNRKRKRHLRKSGYLDASEAQKVQVLMPYA